MEVIGQSYKNECGPGSVQFRVGAAVCPSEIHVKPLSEIAGRLPSQTAPAREGAAFQIRRRDRQAPGEEFLRSAAFSAPAWQPC